MDEVDANQMPNPQKPSSTESGARDAAGVGRIVLAAQGGDRAALDKLADLFWEDIYRMAYFRTGSAMDADDVAQDVFLKAFRKLDKLRDPERFRPWLYSIAVNLVRDFHRKRVVMRIFKPLERAGEDDRPAEAASEAPSALDEALRKEFWQKVGDFTAGLPRREREVFTLRFMDQLGIREIAETLGCGQSAVKTHLYRAVGKFKNKPDLLRVIRGSQ